MLIHCLYLISNSYTLKYEYVNRNKWYVFVFFRDDHVEISVHVFFLEGGWSSKPFHSNDELNKR